MLDYGLHTTDRRVCGFLEEERGERGGEKERKGEDENRGMKCGEPREKEKERKKKKGGAGEEIKGPSS